MTSDLHQTGSSRSLGLVDVLDRVLDKGLVVVGDVKVSLAEVELLTIRIRLIVCSLDKAQQIGLDWWRHDPYLSRGARNGRNSDAALRRQLASLERRVLALSSPGGQGTKKQRVRRRKTHAR